MDDTLKLMLSYVVIPIIITIVGFIMRTIHSRIDHLEKLVPTKLDQAEVRQIVADKIDPLREDIHEIKAKLDRVMDILIERK